MKKIKVLNLYAGIGGNRKLWENVEVTAVESNPSIAAAYKELYPNDNVIIGDAHEYLLEHFQEFEFIWSSPPCPTHSKLRKSHKKKVFCDMKLYQEIILLQQFFKGKWVVENVEPYYRPLVRPTIKIDRHLFWSNFHIEGLEFCKNKKDVSRDTKEGLATEKNLFEILDLNIKDKRLLLRNAVNPKIAAHIIKEVQ